MFWVKVNMSCKSCDHSHDESPGLVDPSVHLLTQTFLQFIIRRPTSSFLLVLQQLEFVVVITCFIKDLHGFFSGEYRLQNMLRLIKSKVKNRTFIKKIDLKTQFLICKDY